MAKCRRGLKTCTACEAYVYRDGGVFCAGLAKNPRVPGDVICFCSMGENSDIDVHLRPDEALEISEVLSVAVRKFLEKSRAYKPILKNEMNSMHCPGCKQGKKHDGHSRASSKS